MLVRTEDKEPRRRLAERLGMSLEALVHLVFDSEVGQQAQLGLVSSQELWEHVRRALNLPSDDIPVIRREFFGGDALDAALLDYIRSLRPSYRTGVISNALDDARQAIRDHWQMEDAFDAIIISAEVKVAKPDVRIYRAALQALDVQPAEAVFIDDFPQNVIGARQAGMQAIQFVDSRQVRLDLERLLNRH